MAMHEAISLTYEPGVYDLWEFHSLDRGRRITCQELWRFVAYACSETTRHITADSAHGPDNRVRITLYGPVADDGRHHYTRRYVHRWECLQQLPREHAREFNRALFKLIHCGSSEASPEEYRSTFSATKVAHVLGLPPRHGK